MLVVVSSSLPIFPQWKTINPESHFWYFPAPKGTDLVSEMVLGGSVALLPGLELRACLVWHKDPQEMCV